MQSQDEVEDGLRLRRDLSQLDTLTGERGSVGVSVKDQDDRGGMRALVRANSLGYIVGISLLLVRECIKVLGNLEPHDAGWRVCQVAFEVLGVHGDVSLVWWTNGGGFA